MSDIDDVLAEARRWENGDGPVDAYGDYDQATLWLGLVQRLVALVEAQAFEIAGARAQSGPLAGLAYPEHVIATGFRHPLDMD